MAEETELAVQAKRKPRSRQKFELKREEILAAATDFINVQGVKGTTLGEVAKMVDHNTTSITLRKVSWSMYWRIFSPMRMPIMPGMQA